MARPRTGRLIYRKTKGYVARLTVEREGETFRETFELGTHDKLVARRKLKRLLEQQAEGAEPAADAAGAEETVDQFAETWLKGRKGRGVAIAEDERRWYETFWRDAIGAKPLSEVSKRDIYAVLQGCATGEILSARGTPLRNASIVQIRGVALRIFDAAFEEELIPANPVARTKAKKFQRKGEVKKERAQVTAEELAAFVACPDVDAEIKMLFLMSRTIGGMRAGDLNGLSWRAFGEGFATCWVPRQKTGGPQELDVPDNVLPFIAAWHESLGKPTDGPVFPVRRGERAGGFKSRRSSSGYAKRLRRELLKAGIDRHELHHETKATKPIDFHTARRIYSTELARAGVNAQQAQVLAGHSDPRVHQRYVSRTTVRALPQAAVLILDVAAASTLVLPSSQAEPRGGRGAESRERRVVSGASRVDLNGIEPSTSALRTRTEARTGADVDAIPRRSEGRVVGMRPSAAPFGTAAAEPAAKTWPPISPPHMVIAARLGDLMASAG